MVVYHWFKKKRQANSGSYTREWFKSVLVVTHFWNKWAHFFADAIITSLLLLSAFVITGWFSIRAVKIKVLPYSEWAFGLDLISVFMLSLCRWISACGANVVQTLTNAVSASSSCIHLHGKIPRWFDHIRQSECLAVKIHKNTCHFCLFLFHFTHWIGCGRVRVDLYKSYLKLHITQSSSAVHSTVS